MNASPAADSLPALLVYEAELILVSARGERRVPYLDFHVGYKRMQLAEDELILAICLKRRFSNWVSYARKVGARNAQAIAKVCVAALGRIESGKAADVRIALGSVAPIPIRLRETERALSGKRLSAETVAMARRTAMAETQPIDDIRSTTRYRAAVAGNLVGEFLEMLAAKENGGNVLARWNWLPALEAEGEILPCCGSRAWAHGMVERRPIPDTDVLLSVSDEIWRSLGEQDWNEAFQSHPRMGESKAQRPVHQLSAAWSNEEQSSVTGDAEAIKAALAKGNQAYERRFGRIFIVCATGKSGSEILETLRRRLQNDRATELRETAEQQRLITHLRLKKWMSE